MSEATYMHEKIKKAIAEIWEAKGVTAESALYYYEPGLSHATEGILSLIKDKQKLAEPL